MDLKYTPRTINEIEVEMKRPMQDVLADYSLRTILLFVKRGLGVKTDDEAYTAIEKYLAEGKDTTELYTDIMEALQDSGFLPKGLNLTKIKKEMNDQIEKGT